MKPSDLLHGSHAYCNVLRQFRYYDNLSDTENRVIAYYKNPLSSLILIRGDRKLFCFYSYRYETGSYYDYTMGRIHPGPEEFKILEQGTIVDEVAWGKILNEHLSKMLLSKMRERLE